MLGRDGLFEKMQLLYQVGRKHIMCLFENPEEVRKRVSTLNPIPRLCVAWPFHETLVFDFAGTLEEYGDSCLLGTLMKETGKKAKARKFQPEDTGWNDGPQLDSYA